MNYECIGIKCVTELSSWGFLELAFLLVLVSLHCEIVYEITLPSKDYVEIHLLTEAVGCLCFETKISL